MKSEPSNEMMWSFLVMMIAGAWSTIMGGCALLVWREHPGAAAFLLAFAVSGARVAWAEWRMCGKGGAE